MSDWANLMIKDRPKSWWAQTKLQSTEQRLLTKKSLAHWTVMTWTVQGNQRWSQGLTTTKECLLRLHMGPGVAPCCRDSHPHRLLFETQIAALFCITGNCNIILNLLVYEWLRMCFLGPMWQERLGNRHGRVLNEMTFTQNVLYPEVLICQCHQANLNLSKRDLTAKSVVGVGGSRD